MLCQVIFIFMDIFFSKPYAPDYCETSSDNRLDGFPKKEF